MKGDNRLVWAAVALFLVILVAGSLLIYAFGALTFGTLCVLWLRGALRGEKLCPGERAEGAIALVSFVWFVLNILIDLTKLQVPGGDPQLQLLAFGVAFLFPPLIMSIFTRSVLVGQSMGAAWKYPVKLSYLICYPAAALVVLRGFGLIAFPGLEVLSYVLVISFILASVYGVFVIVRFGTKGGARDQRGYRTTVLGLFGLMIALFLFLLGSSLMGFNYYQHFRGLVEVASRSMPLCFVFVGTYYGDRYGFFDVFIKRAGFFLVGLVILISYFGLMTPWLDRADVGGLKPWVYAVTLAPLLLVLIWLYEHVEHFLDRTWLGRKFEPAEALKYFLAGVETATSEEELVQQAEKSFADIFQARSEVRLEGDPLPGEGRLEKATEVPVKLRGETMGRIRMGSRTNKTPYFDQDVALLASLADIFSSLLENMRLQLKKQEYEKCEIQSTYAACVARTELQLKKQEHEQRERELILLASRSELKALRAQINPHFLFNALNAIASLIHRAPQQAEDTVEQLAEVFRYTLSRSEKEWVRLEEELEFVRSYLEVERARFGARLEVRMETEEEAGSLEIPSMLIQTLVENAVKHGIASVRGQGVVEVRAARRDGRLQISVADNGPGFERDAGRKPADGREESGGYGLKNVRERLSGYFGNQGKLTLERDSERRMTVVSVEFPVSDWRADEAKTS